MRWKQIKKSKYEISEHGHVRNMLTRRIIKTGCGATSEYLVANINTDGTKRKAHLINRLVAIAFVPNPENKPEVNHKGEAEKLVKKGPEIFVVPLGVDRYIFHENYARIWDSTKTIFMNVGKWELRKGHDVLIECFNEAFSESDNVELHMHCHNPFIGEKGNQEWTDLYMNSNMGQAGKIKISPQRFENQRDLARIMSKVDCGVFPARAEGWNLDALEMLSMGKQLIITNYSGHTQFCNSKNSHLIEHEEKMEDAIDGVFFNGQGEWLEFTDDMKASLVEKMQKVHKNKKELNIEGIGTAKQFSWQHSVQELLKVYE
jgi:glycosyltransferase involved in cell wall biosynthesis